MNPVVRNADAILRFAALVKAKEGEYYKIMRPDPIAELAQMMDEAEEYDGAASRWATE